MMLMPEVKIKTTQEKLQEVFDQYLADNKSKEIIDITKIDNKYLK